ncbi:MAG: oligosaccharide flippase family protein [Chloroflexi bacterium]|nr:oligosaccharide flippase family protein [Chloroflexota bacterium]
MSQSNTSRPSLAQLATRSVLWTGFSQYIFFALGIVKTIFLYRLIGAEYTGLVAGAAVWASYFSFCRFELRVPVFNSNEEKIILNTQFWLENFTAFIGLVIAVASLWLIPNLASSATWAIIFILLGLNLFETLTSTARYIVEKRLRQDVIGRLTLFTSVIGFLIPVGLAISGAPLAALTMEIVLPSLVVGAGAALFTRWMPTLNFDRAELWRQFRVGWTLWTSSLLGKITFQFDDWLVFNLNRPNPITWLGSGVRAEGFYSRAYNAGKMPMDVVAGMIGSVALSLYAESAARGRETLIAAYKQLTWLLTWIICISSTIAFVTADEAVSILFGEAWLPMSPLFRLMFFFIIGRPLFQNNAQLLLALRAETDFRWAMLAQAIFILIACPPAVYLWGAAGASAVVSIMSLIGLIATEWYVAKHLQTSLWQLYLVPTLTSLTLSITLLLVTPLITSNVWLAASFKGIVCATVFGIVLLIFERTNLVNAIQIMRQGLKRSS